MRCNGYFHYFLSFFPQFLLDKSKRLAERYANVRVLPFGTAVCKFEPRFRHVCLWPFEIGFKQ